MKSVQENVRTSKKWISKHPESREVIRQKLHQFSEDPHAPELKNHKLSGTLKGLRAISAGYNKQMRTRPF